MNTCNYEKIISTKQHKREKSWTPFIRQVLVCSGVWSLYFATGMCLGAPTVFIPQLRKAANDSNFITPEMASWISSVFGYTAVPAAIALSILTSYIGRKKTFIFVVLCTLMAFIFLYFSTDPVHFLLSELSQAVTQANTLTASIVILSEYPSPKYRGLFLTLKSATVFWGIWAANAIGTFYHWSMIPVVGFACSLYALTAMIWPESPFYLASTGRHDECAKSHRWLKGTDENSEDELAKLIASFKNSKDRVTISKIDYFKSTLFLREFYKPVLISGLIILQYHVSGKFVCSIYALDIVKGITNDERTAYIGMLTLDGVTVFSMYGGSILARYLKRRTLLFSATSIGICCQFSISLYLYLVKIQIINEYKFVTIALLSVFSVAISCGPILMATTIFGELIPLRFKTACLVPIAFEFHMLQAVILKMAPQMFKAFGLHGTFLVFGISVAICNVGLYKWLPETKDKTLQQIEECFKRRDEQ